MAVIAQKLSAPIPSEYAGMRVDKALAGMFPDYSRTTIQKWLKQGLVLLDDEIPEQRDRVAGGEQVELAVPEAPVTDWLPQAMNLDCVYQDQNILVLNKPAGLVVHPGAGNRDRTLVNGLLHFDSGLARLPRAGIVHRLDKDTTGLMVVARTEAARQGLIEQLTGHQVKRIYLAMIQGEMIAGGVVDEPIGRDPRDRRRMMVNAKGKPAVTHYRVQTRFRQHTLVRVELETGRTHQIRVHMRHLGFPLVGDPVYGGRPKPPPKASDTLREVLQGFQHQALHASELHLAHPVTDELMHWRQPLPEGMTHLVDVLAADRDKHGQ